MIIDENRVFLETSFKTKKELFEFLSEQADQMRLSKEKGRVYYDLWNREEEISTGLQDGFSIPHCRSDNIKDNALFFIRNKTAIPWETFDDSPVYNIICIMVKKEGTENYYLELIAQIATNLLDDSYRKALSNASTKKEIVGLLLKESEEK